MDNSATTTIVTPPAIGAKVRKVFLPPMGSRDGVIGGETEDGLLRIDYPARSPSVRGVECGWGGGKGWPPPTMAHGCDGV